MSRNQFRLIDAMGLVVFAAILFAVIATLNRTPVVANRVHEMAFAAYLAVLSVATLAAWRGKPRWRPFWIGVATFGAVYLAFGLRLGWNVVDYMESESFRLRCQVAGPVGLLCGMAAQ